MTTEDSLSRVSSSESDTKTGKQRKKRKWDQPDESLVSPGIIPIASMGFLAGTALSAVPSLSGPSLAIPFSHSGAIPLPVVQVPLQQHATAIFQKLLQPKIQEELIAREIVINDADSSIRYKLTKRQTQEEIQKNTGAVVITRGKYRPPNAALDGERPLYLHISAASHLETTAERIKAVDHAAAMVEEMLKQASSDKVEHLLSTCVFLGFEADPSIDIVSRIRGPNDQYINHIMKETGATVQLRGRGSEHSQNGQSDESQQPLHLLLSSNDAKKLEHAKLLAENLLDTISADCGASRVSSSKVYGAVPPPPQLQDGVHSPASVSKLHDAESVCSTVTVGFSHAVSQAIPSACILPPNPGIPLANASYHPLALASSTSYAGYGGIYPQATPLQQVALTLKQSTSPANTALAPSVTVSTEDHTEKIAKPVVEKQPKRRKFQELPAAPGRSEIQNQKNLQGTDLSPTPEPASHVVRDFSGLQDPLKPIKQDSNGMLRPPPPPPPRKPRPATSVPPLKSTLTTSLIGDRVQELQPKSVPDTLVKLMQYGDDDEDN